MKIERVPSAEASMLIRRPVGEVFRAFVDPEITTRFWFTESSGGLEAVMNSGKNPIEMRVSRSAHCQCDPRFPHS